MLLKLEELQLAQKTSAKKGIAKPEPMSQADRQAALELLCDANLLDRILEDFHSCGVVGERTEKLVGYLAATSRLLKKPLGLVIQSSSAAGKSSLAEAIMQFMPQEDQLACSAMIGQSLYYLGKENLQHKILFVSEEEGVRAASYQLKLLQSEGRLSLVATSKESGSGRTTTERYEVEGPVALVLTTTAFNVDPELLNRCLVVEIDESVVQTEAIHSVERQSETLAGHEAKYRRTQIERLHQNAQ